METVKHRAWPTGCPEVVALSGQPSALEPIFVFLHLCWWPRRDSHGLHLLHSLSSARCPPVGSHPRSGYFLAGTCLLDVQQALFPVNRTESSINAVADRRLVSNSSSATKYLCYSSSFGLHAILRSKFYVCKIAL